MSQQKILVSVGVPTVTICTATVIIGTIIGSYLLCVTAEECPIFLPTISNTWVNPPGNYISRFIIGVGSAALASLQFAFFIASLSRSTSSGGSPERTSSKTWHTIRLIMGVVACAFLSVVAAVCDSNSAPGCQGNSSLHSFSAVVYFVLYTIVCVSLTADLLQDPQSELKKIERIILSTLILTSAASKLRFLSYSHQVTDRLSSITDFPFVPVIEWIDTTILLVLTCHFAIRATSNIKAVIVKVSPSESGADETTRLLNPKKNSSDSSIQLPAIFIDSGVTYLFFSGIVFASIILSYILNSVTQSIALWPLPTLSDAWANKPGNMLGRWGAVQGGFQFALLQVLLYYLTDPSFGTSKGGKGVKIDSITVKGVNISSATIRGVLLGLGLFSSLTFALVGCINTAENPDVHLIASICAFASYAIYVLITVATIIAESKYCGTITKVGTAAIKLLLSARFLQNLNISSLEALAPYLAYAELADILLNAAFVGVLLYLNDWEEIGVGLTSSK